MVTENQQTISEYFFFKQSTAGEALLTFLQGRLSTHLKKTKKQTTIQLIIGITSIWQNFKNTPNYRVCV